MSWSVSAMGTKEETKTLLGSQFDAAENSYAGKPEAEDVKACRARLFSLVDELVLKEGDVVRASAYGSHSFDWEPGKQEPAFVGGSFSASVSAGKP